MNPPFFELYASEGRPSVQPEQLLLASLLQAFYGIRSERLLLEQLHSNLLFRWFVGLSPDDPISHPTTFTKNRERLLNDEMMARFLEKLMGVPEVKPLLSDEHVSVAGTLLQGWASHASLERINGQDDPPPTPSGTGEGGGAPKPGRKRAKGDFRGIKLNNKTHRSPVIPTPCWPASSMPTRPNRAPSPVSAPLGTTPCAHGQPSCPDRGLTKLVETSRTVITMAFFEMNAEKTMRLLRLLLTICVSACILML